LFKIRIISVGNNPDKNLKELIDSYSKKLSNQFDVDWINVKAEKKFDSTSQKKEYEAKKITAFIENSFVVAMDESGQLYNSKEFTNKMTGWIQNYQSLTFIIGGADGIHQTLINKADFILSLSRMTFPHQLVKLFLSEQLYRCSAILNNHPYHRE
jgi:23S rRNA (pseudouridine1915-N3)-methyltransferase